MYRKVRKFINVKKTGVKNFLIKKKLEFFNRKTCFVLSILDNKTRGLDTVLENRSVSDPHGTVPYIPYSLSLDQDLGFGGSRSTHLGKSRSESVSRLKLTFCG